MRLNYLIILVFFFSCSRLPVRRTDKLSILQGVTNSKEIEFSVVAPKEKELKFELRNEQGEVISPELVKKVTRDHSTHAVHKIIFIRDSASDYNLFAYEGPTLLDQRLVGKVQKDSARIKVAVASCMNDWYPHHFKIWDVLAARGPDYLLLIGDNVYADKGKNNNSIDVTPEILWDRYVDVRLSLPLFFQQKLIPTHAIWDDHDYGRNDGNENFKYKESSKMVFEAFYPQMLSEENLSKGFGVGGLLTLGDFNFYFLDGRNFRSSSSEGPHLGLEQRHWFMNKLREESAPSFIIKGDQFFGGYQPGDSYEGNHPQDFNSFVEELSKINTPFIFLSGDRHMSEIMQFPRGLFGKPSFEITSGPIHAGVRPEKKGENPWRVVAESKMQNFLLIDNVIKDDHWFLEVESIGESGDVFFKRELAVYVKDLQDNLNEVRKRRHGKRSYRKSRKRR